MKRKKLVAGIILTLSAALCGGMDASAVWQMDEVAHAEPYRFGNFINFDAKQVEWRVAADGSVTAHDGRPAQVHAVFTDEQGRVYLRTDRGFGLVHTQDVGGVAEAVEAGRWTPQAVQAAELPAREGYVPSPQAQAGGR